MYYLKCFVTILSIAVMSFGCQQSGSGPQYDLNGYQTESIGSGGQYATFVDGSGKTLFTGHVLGGVRTGVWTTYHDNGKIKNITNYINGAKNGEEITLNDRGQVESIVRYRNDQLHGITVRYKNSRTLSEMSYINGVLDGPFSEYEERGGKLTRTGTMKNGKLHGELLIYNGSDEPQLTYQYNNGELVK